MELSADRIVSSPGCRPNSTNCLAAYPATIPPPRITNFDSLMRSPVEWMPVTGLLPDEPNYIDDVRSRTAARSEPGFTCKQGRPVPVPSPSHKGSILGHGRESQ